MEIQLYYNTVKPQLKNILLKIITLKEFEPFNLVGGTALSLQLGHRISEDIDLFSDIEYGKLDFNIISKSLEKNFPPIDSNSIEIIGMGKSFLVDYLNGKGIKVDVYYTDPFVFPILEIDGIRMASLEEIAAMKLEILLQGGRKKDFWDIDELLNHFSFKEMIKFHEKRYYSDYTYKHWKSCLLNFEKANDDIEPECLRGKIWELIKLDLLEV